MLALLPAPALPASPTTQQLDEVLANGATSDENNELSGLSPLPDGAKWVLSVAMLLGRLELLTVLVLLSPTFWRG